MSRSREQPRKRAAGARAGLALCALGVAPWALAAPPALDSVRVDRPAHFVRGGQWTTLLARIALQPGDRVRTGHGGRAELRFDGALVLTLGQDAELEFHSGEGAMPERGAWMRARLVAGSLRVLNPAGGAQTRDLRLNVGRLRLRAFGAEILAESRSETDRACALNGSFDAYAPGSKERITVTRECLWLAEGGRIARTPRDATVEAMIEATQFRPVETPPLPLRGWTVVIASLADESSARAEAEGLVGEGLPARVLRGQGSTGELYRVAVGGFERITQARDYAESIRQSHGLFEAWVASY